MTNARAVRYVLLGCLLATGVSTGPVTAWATAPGLSFADYVGYASVPFTGSVPFVLSCTASPGTYMTEDVIGTAVDDGSHPNLNFVRVAAHYSSGHWLGVGEQRATLEDRREGGGGNGTAWALHDGLRTVASGAHIGHIAWAVWGSRPTCALSVNGVSISFQEGNGAFGLYAPPEAFGGGVYYQDGRRQVVAARIFQQAALGGGVFAAMFTGSNGVGTFMASSPGEAPRVQECDQPGNYCLQFFVPEATDFSAILHAGVSQPPIGGEASQLWMISLPRVD